MGISARSFPMIFSIGIPMTTIIGAGGLGNMFTVYVLRSDSDGSYYVGSASNMEKRLMQHNKGYSHYTKHKGPFTVIYKEEYVALSEARKREYYIKSLKSRIAIDKIIKQAAFV